jgi:hypothetical protein
MCNVPPCTLLLTAMCNVPLCTLLLTACVPPLPPLPPSPPISYFFAYDLVVTLFVFYSFGLGILYEYQNVWMDWSAAWYAALTEQLNN